MRYVKRCAKLERFFSQNHIQREATKVRPKENPMEKHLSRKQIKRGKKQKKKETAMHAEQQTLDEEEIDHDDVDHMLSLVNGVPENIAPIILALAICYHTRLGTTQLRKQYRRIIFSALPTSSLFVHDLIAKKKKCSQSSNATIALFRNCHFWRSFSGSKVAT
jgi:hypothetical protein